MRRPRKGYRPHTPESQRKDPIVNDIEIRDIASLDRIWEGAFTCEANAAEQRESAAQWRQTIEHHKTEIERLSAELAAAQDAAANAVTERTKLLSAAETNETQAADFRTTVNGMRTLLGLEPLPLPTPAAERTTPDRQPVAVGQRGTQAVPVQNGAPA